MGSFIEMNDTLQLTRDQGFPSDLALEKHTNAPLSAKDFEGKIFSFHGKKDIRCYQQPPVRCFLVENGDEGWIYWGQIFMQSITHDYNAKTTSGTYKIIRIFMPHEMKIAKDLIEFREEK